MVTPKDDSALAKDAQILGLEERSRRRCDGRPESDAGLAPDMARSIGRRLRILDDTVLSDKSGERRGIVGKENLVEAAQHFACLALPGFAGRRHGRAHDRAPCVRPTWARR